MKTSKQPLIQPGGQVALLRLPQVLSLTGLSRSEVYRRIALGAFPRCHKLGPRVSVWSSADVAAWIEAQLKDGPPVEGQP